MTLDEALFPTQLIEAGLDEETLETSLTLQGDWCVKGIPTVRFYRCLHKFLVKWPKSCSISKTAVGKFYMAIDHRLKQKGSRPDNIYRFVEKIILSDEPDFSYMRYGTGYQTNSPAQKRTERTPPSDKESESKLTVTDTELDVVKKKLDTAEEELAEAKCAVEKVTHGLTFLERKNKVAVASKSKTIEHYEQLCQDHMQYEDELIRTTMLISL